MTPGRLPRGRRDPRHELFDVDVTDAAGGVDAADLDTWPNPDAPPTAHDAYTLFVTAAD